MIRFASLVLSMVLALGAPARAWDAAKASRYGGLDLTTLDVGTLTLRGSGAAGEASGLSAKATGTPVLRPFADWLADTPNIKAFGTPTGSDWTGVLRAVGGSGAKQVSLPQGDYLTNDGIFTAAGRSFIGPGQIKYADGTKDAPWRAIITNYQPAPTGWTPSPTDQWTADYSNFVTAARSYVTSAATPPVTNTYVNMNMASMVKMAMQTDAGFNANPADHGQGRTGQTMLEYSLRHTGQGDAGVVSYNIAVGNKLPGATHFLANPASSMYGGNIYALPGNSGVYLQGSEVIFSDNGESVAAIDRVRNYWRRGTGTGLGQVWIHDRPQVRSDAGYYPIDAFYNPGGPAKRGLDLAGADFSAGGQAAIVLAPSQKIYFGGYAGPDSAGLKTVSTSLGFASMYLAGDGNLHIDAGAGKAVVLDNLPTSASGLPTGGLYKDTNGFLKVAP